jgi:hypothetical protein
LVLYNRDEKCLQRGTDWGFKHCRLPFVFKELNQRPDWNEIAVTEKLKVFRLITARD